MIRSIRLADSVREATDNTGEFTTETTNIQSDEGTVKFLRVTVFSVHPVVGKMTLGWGFCDTDEEAQELSKTLTAACELNYDLIKEKAGNAE